MDSTNESRSTVLSTEPTTASLRPKPYPGAVSKKLTPTPRAARMAPAAASGSKVVYMPARPEPPWPMAVTSRPVLPIRRFSNFDIRRSIDSVTSLCVHEWQYIDCYSGREQGD